MTIYSPVLVSVIWKIIDAVGFVVKLGARIEEPCFTDNLNVFYVPVLLLLRLCGDMNDKSVLFVHEDLSQFIAI